MRKNKSPTPTKSSASNTSSKVKPIENINTVETVSPIVSENIVEIAKPKTPAIAKAVVKYKLPKCTTLIFIGTDGSKKEIALRERLATYCDLQREIAKLNPKSRKMLLIQDEKGRPLLSQDISFIDVIRIKECLTRSSPKDLLGLPFDWEQKQYYNSNEKDDEDQYTAASIDLGVDDFDGF